MPESRKQLTNSRQTLDDNQIKAVNHRDGAALVIAGPGSGKTTVITHRILKLVENYRIMPGKILVITFTKAAAVEMKERFDKLSSSYYPVTFCTFHSFFYHIILSFESLKSLPLITEKEKRLILRNYLKTKEIFSFDNSFFDGILKEISLVKNNSFDMYSYKSVYLEPKVFTDCFNFYNEAVRRSGKIDFDDMMTRCLEILESNERIRKMWQERFDYYLIDEFQDINPLQYNIVKLLSVSGNVFAVGDEDQSIYGFRGSSPKFMFRFIEDYNAIRIDLSVNYRSSKLIVDTAREIISSNKARFDKELIPFDTNDGICEIKKYTSDNQMYSDMSVKIKKSASNGESCVILQRTGKVCPELIRALKRENIKFAVKEKPISLFDNSFVKDIISYLYLGYGINKCEYLFRILNKPSRYVSSGFMASIKSVSDPCKDYEFSWPCIMRMAKSKDYLYNNLFFLQNNLQKISKMKIREAVKYIRKMIGYDEYLSKLSFESGIRYSEISIPVDEFEEFVSPFSSVEELTEEMEIIKNITPTNNDDLSDIDVCIMTYHASKGLEWDAVYIPDVCEGNVPHKKAGTTDEIEEERRMFYVAVTRAAHHVWIGTVYNKERGRFPSPFIKI